MSRMRKESNREKKKAKEWSTFIVQQRTRVSGDDVRTGVDETEIIDRMHDIQRFKVDSKSVKRFMEDTERADAEVKRKMSLNFD